MPDLSQYIGQTVFEEKDENTPDGDFLEIVRDFVLYLEERDIQLSKVARSALLASLQAGHKERVGTIYRQEFDGTGVVDTLIGELSRNLGQELPELPKTFRKGDKVIISRVGE